MYMKRALLSLMFPLLLVSCASTPPDTLITHIPENDISLSEVNANPDRYTGEFVRWGGRIIRVLNKMENGEEILQLEVLSYPLGSQGKPEVTASAGTRFITKIYPPFKNNNFYRNRLVTVAGSIESFQDYALASGEVLRLPVINSTRHYTWRDYDDDRYEPWPRFHYHIFYGRGVGYSGSGVGIFFRGPVPKPRL